MPIRNKPRWHLLGALGLFSLLLVSTSALGQINKCEINGQIVYTDQPCPKDTARELKLHQLTTVPATELDADGNRNFNQYSSNRWYVDYKGYREALRVSRARNAPIFIYTYTDWCGYCRVFDAQMLPKSDIKKALSGYVKVRMNPEHSTQDYKLFKRWGGTGYPSLWVQSDPEARPSRGRSPFRQKRLISGAEFVENYALTKEEG